MEIQFSVSTSVILNFSKTQKLQRTTKHRLRQYVYVVVSPDTSLCILSKLVFHCLIKFIVCIANLLVEVHNFVKYSINQTMNFLWPNLVVLDGVCFNNMPPHYILYYTINTYTINLFYPAKCVNYCLRNHLSYILHGIY
jgi:hypothetical protein